VVLFCPLPLVRDSRSALVSISGEGSMKIRPFSMMFTLALAAMALPRPLAAQVY
jgi:hypothetical protein